MFRHHHQMHGLYSPRVCREHVVYDTIYTQESLCMRETEKRWTLYKHKDAGKRHTLTTKSSWRVCGETWQQPASNHHRRAASDLSIRKRQSREKKKRSVFSYRGEKMTTKFTGKEADFRRRQNGSRRGVYSRDTLLSGRFERKNIKFKR